MNRRFKMASIIYSIRDLNRDWRVGKHAEVDKWLLMDDPATILAIVFVYLAFVLKIGPAIMKNRAPLELRKTMIFYNGIQVVSSVLLVWMCLRVELPFNTLFSSACFQKTNINPRMKNHLLQGSWWYFFAKVTELLDTVFFVLRKRNRQITFLHVYHHSVTVIFSWCFLKFAPGEQGAMVGLLNSVVHVFMYTYYMISAMGPAYQKYLWWKKYMTVIQLIQFCMMIAYLSLLVVSDCGHSPAISYFFIGNATVFLYLFSGFYKSAYNKEKKITNNNTETANGSPHGYQYKSEKKDFVDNAQAYSQITRDVVLLSNGEMVKGH